MTITVGFVLVTHRNVDQTALLCRRLNDMFNYPPISIHHDFGQTGMKTSDLSHNVHVVEDWMRTSWASVEIVDANLKALRLLYQVANPDWVISLSNACYPIKTASEITAALEATDADSMIACKLITYDPARDHVDPSSLDPSSRWGADCFERYIAVPVPKQLMGLLRRRGRDTRYIKAPLVTKVFTPFRGGFRCYAGPAWYAVHRSAARALLKRSTVSIRLRRHYGRNRFCPDESYYQTILANEKGLRIANQCPTYTAWTPGDLHPKILGYDDFPKLLLSKALFARKFPLDERLLRTLDDAVSASERTRRMISVDTKNGSHVTLVPHK